MADITYAERRGQLQTYFDRTAADAWARLTSNAPVSRIRTTVRAGRDSMRNTLLGYLPPGLAGRRILDAGCGTGALSIAAAMRGATVVAVDLAGTLMTLAAERTPSEFATGQIEFRLGDMCDASLGRFDHVVAMDSLIHYDAVDVVGALAGLAERTSRSILFTFAPRTPALAVMHAAGRLFPRKDRAPAIEPIAEHRLRERLRDEPRLRDWHIGRTQLITSGFYKSQAMELVKA